VKRSTLPRARRALVAAAIAMALAAAPAEAQRKDPAPRPAPAAAAPGPKLPAADVPLPPPPTGTRLEPRRDATLAVGIGPWAAFDTGESVALHVDYGFSRTPPGFGRLELEYRLVVMISRPSEDTPITLLVPPPLGFTPIAIDGGVEQARVWLIEVVPTARLRLPIGASFALHADAGLGLVQTVETYEREELFVGHTKETQNVTGLVLRLGAGLALDVTPRMRVVLQPLAFSIHIGPEYGGYAPSLGLAYRM